MSMPCLRLLLALWLGLGGCAQAQDFEREKRWADEIVPNLVVGDAVWLKAASGRPFLGLMTATPQAKTAIVLVHGMGVHPDFELIGQLRTLLADRGHATLSIQMPVQAKDAGAPDYHPAVFPDAVDRIASAAAYLRTQGYRRLVLVSHSLGAWMANTYLDERLADTPFTAWVSIGRGGSFSLRTRSYRLTVLDIFGSEDQLAVLREAPARARAIAGKEGSRQLQVPQADHYFSGKESQLADEIHRFIMAQPQMEHR
jgi:alpha/beta superfamily hydrolase